MNKTKNNREEGEEDKQIKSTNYTNICQLLSTMMMIFANSIIIDIR